MAEPSRLDELHVMERVVTCRDDLVVGPSLRDGWGCFE